MDWKTVLSIVVAFAIALAVSLLLAVIVKFALARWSAQSRWTRALIVKLHPRIQLLVGVIAFWSAWSFTVPESYDWWPKVSHGFRILAILAGAWMLAGLSTFGMERINRRFATDSTGGMPEIRRIRTQLHVISRLVNVLIGVVAIGIVLFSFPQVRTLGTSLLASAGIISIIAGLAAQSTLGNLIAGVQVAFTDSIRVGDVVVVEGEWGTIGEITLSYVVVYVWDERRLILPCTYFVNQPYENWTRQDPKIMGSVYMDLDWRVPVQKVREKFHEVLRSTPLWDGRASNVLVTGSQGGFVTLRFLISAKDSDEQWFLMCLVREEIMTWLQQEHPESLPATRIVMTDPNRD